MALCQKELILLKGCIVLFIFCLVSPSKAQETIPYYFFEKKGMEALHEGNYPDAIAFFKEALSINPQAKDSLHFLNTLQRIQQGRINVIEYEEGIRALKYYAGYKLDQKDQDEFLDLFHQEQDFDRTFFLDKSPVGPRRRLIESALDSLEHSAAAKAKRIPVFTDLQKDEKKDAPLFEASQIPTREPDVLYLDDILWHETEARPQIEVELGSSVIFEGKEIERFLVVTPGFIRVDRIDRDRILVTAGQRGRTTLLVWEERGRWSFNVQVIFPVPKTVRPEDDPWLEQSRPFRFYYSSDWMTFYSDEDQDHFGKRSLIFTQRMRVDGESPYGELDSSVIFQRIAGRTEATSYSVGITDGQVGPWSGFSIRGFDARKTFSPLTLSGKHFRGILYDQKSFNDQVHFSYLTGRDRQNYFFISPGFRNDRDIYLRAGRVHLFPKEKHQYAFNYAKGWGDDRPKHLRDEVMSFETVQIFGEHEISGEFAYDTKDFAKTASWHFPLNPEMSMSFNFRDIDKSYTTISASPSHQGEIGGITTFFWNTPHFSLDSFFNVYKDRLSVNPHDPYAYNYDLNTTFRKPIDDRTSFSTSFYWMDTQGLLSPHRSFRVNNYLSRQFHFFEERRLASMFLRQSYQRSRYPYSPRSEYDRLGLSAGTRIPVPFIDNLTYYMNYEHYFVTEAFSGIRTQPHVISAGFNYSKSITDNLYATLGVDYRNEEETQSNFSFLAGEDSVAMSAGLTYSPHPDFNLYIDGAARRVWPEGQDRNNYFDADVRVGARFSWDMPFRWNPQGYVSGIVFKDVNHDGRYDVGEEGIPGVTVTVGNQNVITDESGHYRVKVRGKRVQVGVDFDTVPSGYIFTTPLLQKITLTPHQETRVNFGLSTRSGVYGIVYYDKNQSGRPDEGDEFISGVRILLSGHEATTNHEGAYFFDNIEPGQHEIRIDINSFPIQYIPRVRLKDKIEVQEGTTYIFHIPVTKKE